MTLEQLQRQVRDLETRVAELERTLGPHCERCRAGSDVLRRCRACCRDLCPICMTLECPSRSSGSHDPVEP